MVTSGEVRDAASVPEAKRLVTSIDTDDPASMPRGSNHQMSVTAELELELDSGRRLTLLDDRGWAVSGPSNIWACTSLEELADTARTVVGPDEPADGSSYDDADEGYWAQLAANAEAQGVRMEPGDLAALPHDVVISQKIQARVARATR